MASGPIRATVAVPGSKSVSNRALICAALARGGSSIRNIAPGDDTVSMLECLELLGVAVEVVGSDVSIRGVDGRVHGGATVDARLAGTTSRFVTALAALGAETTTITGDPPLRARPMGDLHSALRHLGAQVRTLEDVDRLPVQVSGGDLRGGSIRMSGDVSSQFLSAVMLIAPYLPGGVTFELIPPVVSRPYIDMTVQIMGEFGAQVVSRGESPIVVSPGGYVGRDFIVEPDASSASYPLAAAAITAGVVAVPGLNSSSHQGDVRFLQILEQMGCEVSVDVTGAVVRGTNELKGIDIDMADISDLVPTVAVMALFARDTTRIRNVSFIKAKESDRLARLVDGIIALGGRAEEVDTGLDVHPLHDSQSRRVVLETHHDHRLAMAWSLVALRRAGIAIDDPSVVSKSWPQWWSVRDTLVESSLK